METIEGKMNGVDLAPGELERAEVVSEKLEGNTRVRVASVLDVVSDELANAKRKPEAMGVVAGYRDMDVREKILVRHDDGSLASYARAELEVIEAAIIEVKRWALMNAEIPWPKPSDRAFEANIPAPALLKKVVTYVLRPPPGVPGQPIAIVRLVFLGCPDAQTITKRFLISLEEDAINLRVDRPESEHPRFVDCAVNPLTGGTIGIWESVVGDPGDDEIEIPIVKVKEQIAVTPPPQPDAT